MADARFEVYEDEAGGWRFRLVAANGEQVGRSSEAYDSKWNARRGVLDFVRAAVEASDALRREEPEAEEPEEEPAPMSIGGEDVASLAAELLDHNPKG